MLRGIAVTILLALSIATAFMALGRGEGWNLPVRTSAILAVDLTFIYLPALIVVGALLGRWSTNITRGFSVGVVAGFLVGALVSAVDYPSLLWSLLGAVVFGAAGAAVAVANRRWPPGNSALHRP